MRTFSLVLAGTLAVSPPSGATGTAPSTDSSVSAEALFEAGERAFGLGDFDRAIENFEAAYAASKLVVILYNVGLSYMRRFEISGDRKDLLRAKAVLRNYVLALESDPSLGQPDDAKDLLRQIDQLLGAPTEHARPHEGSERRSDGLKIGAGTVGGLAGASLVVALATAATIARQPFQGGRYRAIYEAAQANGVPHGPGDDMCALGKDISPVADACGRRATMRNVSVAMLAVTVVLGATAVALGVVHARRVKTSRVSLVVDPYAAFLGVRGRF